MYRNSRKSTARLTVLALLAALVVVLQTVASGIKIGPVPITLTLVPIVIGAVLMGPQTGAVLGGIFGVVTLVAGIIGVDPFTFMLWSASPVWTIVVCLAKAILCGLVAGLVYRAFGEKHTLGCVAAAVVAPVVNTGVFALAMLTVFRTILADIAGGTDAVYFLFMVMIGVNFLVEFAVNAVLSAGIARVAQAVTKQMKQ